MWSYVWAWGMVFTGDPVPWTATIYIRRLAAARKQAEEMQLDLDKLRIYESELDGHCHKMQQRGLEADQELNTLGESINFEVWTQRLSILWRARPTVL